MIKFIKKLFKTNINEEVKKDTEHNESESKANIHRSHQTLDFIMSFLCHSISSNQVHCSPLLIYKYEQLLSLNVQEDIDYAYNLFRIYLSESQIDDFNNKLNQSKEYKEYKIRKRIEEISKDFN